MGGGCNGNRTFCAKSGGLAGSIVAFARGFHGIRRKFS